MCGLPFGYQPTRARSQCASSVPDSSARRQTGPDASVHLVQRRVDRFWLLCDDGTLLLLFRGGGPRAALWIRTYGTQAKKRVQSGEATEEVWACRLENGVNPAVANCLSLSARSGV